jgi:hypothetical protein
VRAHLDPVGGLSEARVANPAGGTSTRGIAGSGCPGPGGGPARRRTGWPRPRRGRCSRRPSARRWSAAGRPSGPASPVSLMSCPFQYDRRLTWAATTERRWRGGARPGAPAAARATRTRPMAGSVVPPAAVRSPARRASRLMPWPGRLRPPRPRAPVEQRPPVQFRRVDGLGATPAAPRARALASRRAGARGRGRRGRKARCSCPQSPDRARLAVSTAAATASAQTGGLVRRSGQAGAGVRTGRPGAGSPGRGPGGACS